MMKHLQLLLLSLLCIDLKAHEENDAYDVIASQHKTDDSSIALKELIDGEDIISCSDELACTEDTLCQRHSALLLKFLYDYLHQTRTPGSLKQIYQVSAELANIGLGINFSNTNFAQTTKVAPQFSNASGGIQQILIGSPESNATQPSIIEIGTTVATATGTTTIEIGGGAGQTTITLGNTNPASTFTIPSNVIVTGDLMIPGSLIVPMLNLPGNLNVAGDSTVAGMLTAGTLITSDLMFTNINLAGNLTVDGTSTLNGNVQAHAGASIDGGGVTISTGATQLSLTSTQDAANAIMLSAAASPVSGITAGVGATGGFNIVGGPLRAQGGVIATGAFTQSGGAVSLNAGANTITLTSTNAAATAIQFNGNAEITGTTDVQGLLTASAGLTIENNGLMVSAGNTTITGPLSQMNGSFSLQATGTAAVNGNSTITIGGTNATSVNFGHSGIATTVVGDLIETGGALSLTASGTAAIDGTTTLSIGNTNATAVTIGNTTASTKVTLEAGNTGSVNIGDSAFPHIIDIGTGGTMASHIQTINIATSDTPANPINIGGDASSTMINGNLIKTGSGNIDLTSDGNATVNSTVALNIGSTTVNTISIANRDAANNELNIESGTTASGGRIDFGVANTAHTITFGSLAGAGTQTINIANLDDTQANVITFGGVSNAAATNIGGELTHSGGTFSLQANNAGGTAGIFGDNVLNIGTPSATAVTIGNNAAATHSVTFEGGSSGANGINIGSTNFPHIINIGTGSPGLGGQTINIGTGSSANPIAIGGGTSSTITFNGGLTQSGGPYTLNSTGTGSIDGNGTINIGASATTLAIANRGAAGRSLTIDTAPGGTINIGNSNNTHTINIGAGSAAAANTELLTVGSTTSGTSITFQSGTTAMGGIRYQIGNTLIRPLSPIGFSLPTANAPIGLRVSTGAFRNTPGVTIAGTGDWTRAAGVITFTNPYTANSICYVAVLDYGATDPRGGTVTPVFKNATLVNIVGTTTLTVNALVAGNFYGFTVIGR